MLTIGVSGHRNLSNFHVLSIEIDEVLNEIQTLYKPKSLQIISSLAEGADRIVVWRAIENFDAQLIVPLPIAKSDYLTDFKLSNSKKEFSILLEMAHQIIEIPKESSRPASYLAAGLYMLNHCDVLITLWDGKPAKGMGGTAEIVSEARKRRKPMAWVNTTEGGAISYENFPIKFKSEYGDL